MGFVRQGRRSAAPDAPVECRVVSGGPMSGRGLTIKGTALGIWLNLRPGCSNLQLGVALVEHCGRGLLTAKVAEEQCFQMLSA